MNASQLFAGTPVADFDASLAWYERFMGRPPDVFPHEREAVWQVTDTGWLYIVETANAGRGGVLTLMVDDLERLVVELEQRGIGTEGITWVVPGSARSAWITDPEGNRIQLAQVLEPDA